MSTRGAAHRLCTYEAVVLSAALLSRNGKVLVARQFVEITRIRLEGLLTAFPKLLSSGTREHTFIDTESVRYVYQPLENYFVLIITNKTSNIVEDLQTIQLLAKLVPDICGSLSEASIRDKQFELVFGFDELLTAGGHSENITLQQVRINMEMESHEEKLHNMILESKRAAAKDDMKRNMTRIKEEQRERARLERGMSNIATSAATSFGNSMSSSFGRSPRNAGDSFGSSGSGLTSPTAASFRASPAAPTAAAPLVPKAAGMKLGGGSSTSTGKSFLDAMAAEDGLQDLPPLSATIVDVPPPPVAAAVSHDPVGTVVEEKITVSLNRDGSIEQIEIKGNLYVNVNDPASGCVRLKLRSTNANGISFQTHPKVDKKLFDQASILGLKDSSKPFPATRVAVLRWSVKSTDDALLPLNLTCWPDREGSDKLNVTIEYEMQRPMALDNVNIVIPLGSHDAPNVASIDGVYQHNAGDGTLLWHQDRIDESNGSGAMEFSIRGHDLDAFFPIQVSFFSRSVYSDVDIESVFRIDDNAPVQFGFEKLLSTDAYQIV